MVTAVERQWIWRYRWTAALQAKEMESEGIANTRPRPFVTAYGKADPVLGFFDTIFQEHVPGAKRQPHRQFQAGTHFIQEEEPDALIDTILAAAAA